MENIQRLVMLLKPDAHIMGRWDSGATLRLSAVPDGAAISLKLDGHTASDGGVLTLFMRGGSFAAAGEIKGPSLNMHISGVDISDIAGAAVIREDRFLLKSAHPDWPAMIARYRYECKQRSTARDEIRDETTVKHHAATQEPAAQKPEPQSFTADAAETPPANTPSSANLTTRPDAYQAEPDEAILAQQPYEREPDDCPQGTRQHAIDPFPGLFPGSEWVKISYPGPAGWWHYIFGRANVNGHEADVIGVPGEYSMAPPVWLDGFSTWMRCASGDARGYWLMFQDAQTGRCLDISRFRHGG